MRRLFWMLVGVLVAVVVALFAIFLVLRNAQGLSARAMPAFLETWVARKARQVAMPDSARALQNPVTASPAILAEGLAHWADHCSGCHANDGSGETAIG